MRSIARMGPQERAESWRRATTEGADVVVVGGGITGAGTALDAASRGLRTVLVERDDLASGTSSRSTKLIHGGIRYLERLRLGLVSEALSERALMLSDLCPHLVHPVPILFPFEHRLWERAYVGAGVLLYDTLGAGRRGAPAHRHLSRGGALALAPELREDAFVGAIRYYDAQVDDARHTMAVARTAVHQGATVLTHAPAVGLETGADGAVRGVRVRDALSGEEATVRAERVINATGPWTDQVQGMAGAPSFRVRPSKGIHLTLPRARLDLSVGLITRTEKSVLFVLPWGAHWLIGTTDTDWDEPVDDVAATGADVDYVLGHLNRWVRRPVAREEVTGVFAGLRPLVAAEEGSTADLSREHAIAESAPGLWSIGGGKYTTYRVMAADVVDAAVAGLDREVPASPTRFLPLLGAVGYHAVRREREALAARHGLDVAWIDHLLARQGDLVEEVLALLDERPELARPLEGAEGYLAVEALYAVTHEGALDLDDVLARRLRARAQTADRGAAAAEPVARLVADALGWDEGRIAAEVGRYRAAVEAERAAESTDDDAEAASRLRAARQRAEG